MTCCPQYWAYRYLKPPTTPPLNNAIGTRLHQRLEMMMLPKVEIRTIPAPDIELSPVRETSLCDTCCGVPVSAAYLLSERIVMIADTPKGEVIVHAHEHQWFACRLCELLIDARDVDNLVERARSASKFPDPDDLLGRLNGAMLRLVVEKRPVMLR